MPCLPSSQPTKKIRMTRRNAADMLFLGPWLLQVPNGRVVGIPEKLGMYWCF